MGKEMTAAGQRTGSSPTDVSAAGVGAIVDLAAVVVCMLCGGHISVTVSILQIHKDVNGLNQSFSHRPSLLLEEKVPRRGGGGVAAAGGVREVRIRRRLPVNEAPAAHLISQKCPQGHF